VSGDGRNRWQDGINAWIAGQGDSRFHPPTETYSGGDALALSIKEPGDGQQINDNNVKITVKATSTNGISKIEVFAGGDSRTANSDTFSETMNMSEGSYQSIRAKATDSKGNTTESEIHIGVKKPYATPAPTPLPTSVPTPTSLPTPIP
jgi:hypothetical protein